jgi:carbonic anhydrase
MDLWRFWYFICFSLINKNWLNQLIKCLKPLRFKSEQNNWSREFHSCGGKGQSPINININEVKVNPSLNLELIHYDKPHKNMIANNNGHTGLSSQTLLFRSNLIKEKFNSITHWLVRITLNHKSSSPHISGTAVNGRYTLEEIHFHWGDNDFDGTEHLVDNLKGSAEVLF